MSIKGFSNKIISGLNHLLYDSRQKVHVILRAFTFLSSIAAIGILIFIYGFNPDLKSVKEAFLALNIIFGVFVLAFFTRFFYAFQRTDFIKDNKVEAILILLIAIHGIFSFVLGDSIIRDLFRYIHAENIGHFYRMFISMVMFVVLALEFTKVNTNISAIKIKPSTTFVLSFILLISCGTGLLMLPAMTVDQGSMAFLDALFTSVSASCVTGLIVVDTATFFTYKGQLVILLLIQLGGLGIVSFASFFATYVTGGFGIKHNAMLQDFTSSESLHTAKDLLKRVVLITFVIESVTFVLLYFSWSGEIAFRSISDKIFFTAFHAISAFCNAGFSLFSNNLYEPIIREAYIFHLIIAASVILGGIGFNTIQDLLSPSALRKRLKSPWMEWTVSTKIAVWVSVALLGIGTIGIFFLEKSNTLAGQSLLEAFITSFFQSAISRTAGFNSVDMSQLMVPTLILMMFLMFIGGSSNSIAGGIKTSTFYLIIASAMATIRGKEKIEIGKRFIPKTLLYRALSVFFFAASINLIGIFVLSISEPDIGLEEIAFEQISAFGTVGLSTGITANLSIIGKTMIICSMFLGRVGILTFAYTLTTPSSSSNYKYPKAHLMVG